MIKEYIAAQPNHALKCMIKIYIATEPLTLRKDETTQNYSITRFSLMESNSIQSRQEYP